MTTRPTLDDLLARLQRQEQRTDALEAALHEAPTVLAPRAPAPPQTVPAHAGETPVAPRGRREAADGRPARPRPEFASPTGSAISPVAVLGSLDDVVWSVSPDGQLVFFAGGAVEKLYGVSEFALQDGRGAWLDALPPDDRARLRAALARLPDADTFSLEHRVEHAAGGHRWAVSRGKLVRDRDGRPLRVDGITTDVTHTATAREAVLAVLEGVGPATGREFLARLARHLCAACGCRAAVIVEPHPHAAGEARVSAAWIDGRGAEPFELPERGLVRELLAGGRVVVPDAANERHPADPLVQALCARAIAAEPLVGPAGLLLGFVALADDRPFPPDGDPRAVLRALAPRAAVELGRADTDLATDLAAAERRADEAERMLRAAADLAAAGHMAAGVAHDFNNLLGVVVGNADLMREALPEGDPHRETAETIVRAAQTVAGLSRKVLAVGRSGSLFVAPLDVRAAVLGMEPVLRQLAGRSVRLDFDLAPHLPLIPADAAQFDRVLLNLVLNARDATEARGDRHGAVTVRAARAGAEGGRPRDPAPGAFVALTVSDNGCGMTPEVREQMFRSFFTTKGARGTGLGLATVHEIVTAAGGRIEVESDVGWGTQMRVYWPALPEPGADAPGPPRPE